MRACVRTCVLARFLKCMCIVFEVHVCILHAWVLNVCVCVCVCMCVCVCVCVCVHLKCMHSCACICGVGFKSTGHTVYVFY